MVKQQAGLEQPATEREEEHGSTPELKALKALEPGMTSKPCHPEPENYP